MSTFRRLHIPGFVMVLLLTVAGHGAAQDGPSDDVRRELAVLRAEIQRLRADLDAIRETVGSDSAATFRRSGRQADRGPAEAPSSAVPLSSPQPPQAADAQSALELLRTQVAELAQVKVESASRMPVKVFGTIHTNAFANSGDPNWLDRPNLLNARPADGRSGSFSTTLRQTRLGFTVDGPALRTLRTSGMIAMDFFGGIPGFATGQVMGLPRLLVAFARLEGEKTAVEVGQDHMILAPLDPTSLASLAFPALFRSGNLYLRTPQVRVERALTSRLRATGGIVAPIGGDVPGEDYRFVPQSLSGERSRRPALQARLAFSTAEPDALRRLAVGVSAHYGWERRGAVLAGSSATAVDFSVRRDRVGAAGELFAGRNIDAFGGALGLDARAGGGWAEAQVFPSERLSFAVGMGKDELRGPRLSLPRRRNRSAYGTAIFSLTPEIQASLEYHWLAMLPGSGAERRNHHFDWVLAYKF